MGFAAQGGAQPAPMQTTQATAPSQPNIFQQGSSALTGAVGATAAQAMPRAGGFGAGLSDYYNPFEAQVVGNLQRDTGRMMEMGANQLGAQASQAGAFGGSRHGIAQGQMMGDAMRNFQNQAAQLRMGGYNQAVANRRAEEQAQLGAANQLGNLGQTAFGVGMDMSDQSFRQGQLQQAMNQAIIDNAMRQYEGFQNAPFQSLQAFTSALGAAPAPVSNTQTTSRDIGLFDYLTLGATYAGAR